MSINYNTMSDIAYRLEEKNQIDKENAKTPQDKIREQQKIATHNARVEATSNARSATLQENPLLAENLRKAQSNLEKMLEENYHNTKNQKKTKHSERAIEAQNKLIKLYYVVLDNPAKAAELEASFHKVNRPKELIAHSKKEPNELVNFMKEKYNPNNLTLKNTANLTPAKAKTTSQQNTR